jgi:hypothetical protein
VFHSVVVPFGRIHDLSKQHVDELAGQLGLPLDGTLDDWRKRVKQKLAVLGPTCLCDEMYSGLESMCPVWIHLFKRVYI